MAKGAEPACARCRREGMKLFLKGARCDGPKCSAVRRPYPPGQRSFRRGKLSEYAIRLREKIRTKRYYGVGERQFKRLFALAERQKGDTGENLFRLLERRLDNVIYRAGLAHSRDHSRQLIAHGHIRVNGRRTDRPSRLLKPNDLIEVAGKDDFKKQIQDILEQNKEREVPSWISVDKEALQVRVQSLPPSEEVGVGFQPQLVVEICSR